ncbi:F-box only protein 6 isoform X2 [Hyaena hyaena]|uniref:F-box only protein 6 isoform X2 n=1 Tax=Hyaena hyaena TaxID=95912 RepID=UPI00192265A2|nr:F-box only protein 6 isoform X2 [Hyaena hyaena]
MAPVSINELPENILLEVLTHIPARQLLLCCRLVCSLWRDLIDLVTLWKRKCLREGFVTEDWDQPVADWKIFFFLCSLRRNLLRNPCAEENMTSWQIDSNGGDHWKVESLPGDHGTDFPDSRVKKYFVTSFAMCLKSQLVDLRAEGYWEELLDTFRPDIVVKDCSFPGSCSVPRALQGSGLAPSSSGRTLIPARPQDCNSKGHGWGWGAVQSCRGVDSGAEQRLSSVPAPVTQAAP